MFIFAIGLFAINFTAFCGVWKDVGPPGAAIKLDYLARTTDIWPFNGENMETMVTAGIRVSVETFYQGKHSDPQEKRFVHAYRITIRNEKKEAVQLMRRHWHIRDSNNMIREVEGEGVIGEQPVIESGGSHQYVSWSQLFSDIGKMYGVYLMKNLSSGEQFEVHIPEFTLVAPVRLN